MDRRKISRRSLAAGMATLGGALIGTTAAVAASASGSTRKGSSAGASKLPAEDRLDLIELMSIYAWAYDTEDAALLASTFTPDGKLVVFGNVLVEGREGFSAFIDQAKEMKGEHGWQHLADHHVFRDYDGQSCNIYSYYTMAESDLQGGNVNMRAMGYYASHCVRDGTGWLFTERSVVRWNGELPFKA